MPAAVRAIIFSIILFSCLGAGPRADHPFHVGVVTIDHNTAERSVELTCKLFTDDFENALRKHFNVPVDLASTSRHAAMDTLIARYLREELVLTINGKKLAGNYLGFEQDKEAVYAYVEYPGISKPTSLQADCGLMYGFFDDQVNIFHVTVGGQRKSSKLNYPNRQITFEL